MSDFDGEAGQVENVKDKHYCMGKSFEARNNESMNKGMGYNNMADQANTPHPPTAMHGEKRNNQKPAMAGSGSYNYNANRS